MLYNKIQCGCECGQVTGLPGLRAVVRMKSRQLHPPPIFFFFFLGLNPWHMEGPRQGGPSQLQLLAYATATAPRDLSHIFDLHHSSWQHRILNPQSKSQGSNLHPHGYYLDSFPLHHDGNSSHTLSCLNLLLGKMGILLGPLNDTTCSVLKHNLVPGQRELL